METGSDRKLGTMPYRLVALHEYTTTGSGWQVYHVPASDHVEVLPGDIIGYVSGSRAKLATRYAAFELDDEKHASSGLPIVGEVLSASPTSFGLRHLLRGIVSRPSRAVLTHTYAQAGEYVVKMNVSNLYIDGWEVAVADVAASAGVNATVIESPPFVITNSTAIFKLAPHSGKLKCYADELRHAAVYCKTYF